MDLKEMDWEEMEKVMDASGIEGWREMTPDQLRAEADKLRARADEFGREGDRIMAYREEKFPGSPPIGDSLPF